MTHSHAVVWVDLKEAHVFHFNAEDVEKDRIRAHTPFQKVHQKAGTIGDGHTHLDRAFLDWIAEALRGTREWLLLGPGIAKHELLNHLKSHAPRLVANMVAIETADHPTDRELVDHARRLFQGADRMRANSPDPGGKHFKPASAGKS